MNKHNSKLKLYFDSCYEKNAEPTFEGFIKHHYKYVKANIEGNHNDYSNWLTWFTDYAKAQGVKALKGFAKKAWEEYVVGDRENKGKKTAMVLCKDHGLKEEMKSTWLLKKQDVIELFNQERRRAVEDVEAGNFIEEKKYLLLSFVVEVPLEQTQFVLDVNYSIFKMLRKTLLPSLKKTRFESDILVMFFSVKKVWELKEEDDEEGEEGEEEEDDDDDEEGEEEGEEEEEDDDDDDDEDDEDDVDLLLYQMTKAAKKSKRKEEAALARILLITLDKLKNWKKDCGTEEAFIDQHLYPFLEYIFLQDKKYEFSWSYGRIVCDDNLSDSKSAATTTGSKSISAAKPDFFVFYPLEDKNFGLLCIEVKKPNAVVSQSLSDRSKLALEMKRSIDHQVFYGVRSPKCFGLLVDGFLVTSFVAELGSHGLYTFLELEEFSLLKGKADLGVLPDTLLSFFWVKAMMDEAAASMKKRRKTDSSSLDLSGLVKPTVAFPSKKSNSSK